ncbi:MULTISPECIES: pseudaminic acid synthase [unclassified Adlercreutzia]|uniref:pseudaminic acid synthase n=1 Tax=unclassified Adlercreutzia TaxID=2636013 RepID=UPI0013ECA22E|nr:MULTISPECIES: pseudaminic acid synthase [unclassified Adlercreutzia]
MRLFDTIERGGVYFIAEMSGNHGGSIDNAMRIVRSAAEAGADCLKLQTYTADTITIDCDSPDFQTQAGGLWEGRTLYDLYQEAYTPWEWQGEIKGECERLGMDFLSSVFDPTSVDFLESIGCEMYKIASPELVDIPLIRYAASKGKPMVMSCGMGSVEEIRDAVEACRSVGNDQIVLLKCTSEYPAVYEDMNIATMADMRERFRCAVGLSDHSMGWSVDVAAAVLGASVIEKHYCLTRREKTVDSEFSMEPDEFASMVRDIQRAKAAVGHVTYDRTEREERGLFGRRSLYAVRDIRAGELFTLENVRSIRPGYGLAPKHLPSLLGKAAPRDIAFGSRIERQDLEG